MLQKKKGKQTTPKSEEVAKVKRKILTEDRDYSREREREREREKEREKERDKERDTGQEKTRLKENHKLREKVGEEQTIPNSLAPSFPVSTSHLPPAAIPEEPSRQQHQPRPARLSLKRRRLSTSNDNSTSASQGELQGGRRKGGRVLFRRGKQHWLEFFTFVKIERKELAVKLLKLM